MKNDLTNSKVCPICGESPMWGNISWYPNHFKCKNKHDLIESDLITKEDFDKKNISS